MDGIKYEWQNAIRIIRREAAKELLFIPVRSRGGGGTLKLCISIKQKMKKIVFV